jgi:hypothetical protein
VLSSPPPQVVSARYRPLACVDRATNVFIAAARENRPVAVKKSVVCKVQPAATRCGTVPAAGRRPAPNAAPTSCAASQGEPRALRHPAVEGWRPRLRRGEPAPLARRGAQNRSSKIDHPTQITQHRSPNTDRYPPPTASSPSHRILRAATRTRTCPLPLPSSRPPSSEREKDTFNDKQSCPPPSPPPRTKWTRRVPHPVLIGQIAELTYPSSATPADPGVGREHLRGRARAAPREPVAEAAGVLRRGVRAARRGATRTGQVARRPPSYRGSCPRTADDVSRPACAAALLRTRPAGAARALLNTDFLIFQKHRMTHFSSLVHIMMTSPPPRPGSLSLAGFSALVRSLDSLHPVPPPPPSRTNWTRLVPLPVLTGRVSSGAQDPPHVPAHHAGRRGRGQRLGGA